MRKINTGILPLMPCLLLAACEQHGQARLDGTQSAQRGAPYRAPDGAVATLATNSRSYSPGNPITVSLQNRSRTRLSYNLCRASLDRNTEDDWRQVQATLGEVCTAELRTLYPGQTAAFSFRTDRQMRRGQYRIRSEMADVQGGAHMTALSNSFMLEGNNSD